MRKKLIFPARKEFLYLHVVPSFLFFSTPPSYASCLLILSVPDKILNTPIYLTHCVLPVCTCAITLISTRVNLCRVMYSTVGYHLREKQTPNINYGKLYIHGSVHSCNKLLKTEPSCRLLKLQENCLSLRYLYKEGGYYTVLYKAFIASYIYSMQYLCTVV